MASHTDTGPILVRAAALPVQFWLQASNPDLFDLVRQQIALKDRISKLGRKTGLAIGDKLIPLTSISDSERHLLLNLRRDLHANRPCDVDQAKLAHRLLASTKVSAISDSLNAYLCAQRQLADLRAKIERAITLETARLHALPARIAAVSPTARVILQELGQPQSKPRRPKKARRDFERAWRHVVRAAANPTPRGWMAHVGLCIPEIAPTSSKLRLTVDHRAHVYRTQSVHWLRRGFDPDNATDWPTPKDRICVNPLHWSENAEFFSVTVRSDIAPQASLMPETELLQAVLRACGAGTLAFQDLSERLKDEIGLTTNDCWALTRYLASRGVLEPARQRVSSHLTLSLDEAPSAANECSSTARDWIDVYRHAALHIPAPDLDDLRADLDLAVSLLHRIDPPYRSARRGTDEQDHWHLADVLKNSLLKGAETADVPGPSTTRDETLGPSVTPLLDRLFNPPEPPENGTIRVSRDIAHELNRNTMGPAWPLDCVIRPAGPDAPYRFVLRGVWPAGTITSRFAQGLRGVFSEQYGQNAYRSFLQRIEKETGYSFLEILAPPVSQQADNAVCRPCFTSFFTGDPNKDLYLGPCDAEYVDLDQLSMKIGPNGLTCSSNHRKFWPIYHATRSCSSPWDAISRTLLAAAPLAIPSSYRNLIALLANGHTSSPRLMLGKHLVLCPATWTLATDQVWPMTAPLGQKLIFLADLRAKMRLPRWLEVSAHGEVDFVGCDLESLDAIRTLEKALAVNGSARLVEMLPTPEHLVLTDTNGNADTQFAAELVLRTPGRRSMTDLADKVIAEIGAA